MIAPDMGPWRGGLVAGGADCLADDRICGEAGSAGMVCGSRRGAACRVSAVIVPFDF